MTMVMSSHPKDFNIYHRVKVRKPTTSHVNTENMATSTTGKCVGAATSIAIKAWSFVSRANKDEVDGIIAERLLSDENAHLENERIKGE
jgi:hypothetical protein